MNKTKTEIYEQVSQPHDTETERAVLSTLMRYNDKIALYSDLLDASLFYYDKEKAIFRTIFGVVEGGGITDINSLYNYSQSHDVGFELFRNDFVEIVSNLNLTTLEQDIMRLRDMGRRRTSWRMLQEQSQRILDMTNDFDEEVNVTMSMMNEVQGDCGNAGISSQEDAVQELVTIIKENQQGKHNHLITGFKLFDEHYLLRPDTLTVIAAFTSVGKSALAMNIVQAVASGGVPCAYYSLEMGKTELVSRCISMEANMSASTIMNKRLTKEQMEKIFEVTAKNKALPIYYDDRSTVSFDKTLRSIRTMVKTKGVKLVVIDYLQIYAQTSDDAEQSISYMARSAKNIAKELGIAVILISQLNRSALHPSIKMLRGSGQIEESADNIVLIDRPDAYPDNKVTRYEGEFKDKSIKNTAKLILAKGRGVGIGCALVGFDGAHTRFMELEHVEGGSYKEQDEPLPF